MNDASTSRSLSSPARLALGIMIAAAIILVATTAGLAHVASHGWLSLFLHVAQHAAEGALVGGICDFIAVKLVYSKAEAGFEGLVTNVSTVVIRDMVQLKTLLRSPQASMDQVDTRDKIAAIRARLMAIIPPRDVSRARVHQLWTEAGKPRVISWLLATDLRGMLIGRDLAQPSAPLQSKAVRDVVARCIAIIADDARLARELSEATHAAALSVTFADLGFSTDGAVLGTSLHEAWMGMPRARFVGWLADLDLRAELRGGDASVLRDRAVRQVIAECLRAAIADPARLAEFNSVARTKLPSVVPGFVADKIVPMLVGGLAGSLESEGSDPRVAAAFENFVRGYLEKWHSLSHGERERAAQAVADAFVPPFLGRAGHALAPLLAATSLAAVTDVVVTPGSVQRALGPLATRMREEPSAVGRSGRLWDAIIAYLSAYLDAWHSLPEGVRGTAANGLVDAVGPGLIDALFDVAWQHRETFLDLDSLARSEAAIGLLDHVASRADTLESVAVDTLKAQLMKHGKKGFVGILKMHTQESLDGIKVNGTISGGVLGALIGAITTLCER